MKRVLHVTEAYGGGVVTAIDAYLRNADKNLENRVLARVRGAHKTGATLPSGTHFEGVEIGLARFAFRLWREIRQFRPDVIHAHSAWAGFFVRIMPSRSTISVVYSPHAFAFLRSDLPGGIVTRLGITVAEHVLARRTTVFAVAGQFEESLTYGLCPSASIVQLPPIIMNVPELHEKQEFSDAERLRDIDLCSVGRLAAQKDPEYFADTVSEMRSRGWSGRAVWIGDGPKYYRQRLEDAGVEVRGWLERSSAISILLRSRLYMHTAKWEASVPYSVIEAAYCGALPVCREIPPLKDRPGLMLASSPGGLAEVAIHLLSSREERDRRSFEAHSLVESSKWADTLRASLRTVYS